VLLASYVFQINGCYMKLRKYGLDEWSVRLIENWLNGRAQSVVISGAESS